MQKIFALLSIAGAALLCGCGKQTKINTEEIKSLSQQMVQLQQSQAKQMAAIQSQLTSLTPMLDKISNFYFEKARENELTYHTNTLYLLLAVDKNIETELQVAATERAADSSLAFSYHTNAMDLIHYSTAQIQEAMIRHEGRIEENINAETKRIGADLSAELQKQIRLTAPNEAEIARRKQLEADVAQIKRDLVQIKAQLAQMTNQPPVQP